MEGKRSLLIVLIAVLVFLSLAVAVLAGYVFVFTGPSNNAGNSASAENILNNAAASVKEEDLSSKLLFEQSKAMNLKSDDNKKINVILLNIEIKYFKSIKKVDEIVTRHDSKMKEIVATYFQGMTIDDVKAPETKEKARKDLVKLLNDTIATSENDQRDYIYTINFNEWFYQ